MIKHDDGGPAKDKTLLDEFAGQALISIHSSTDVMTNLMQVSRDKSEPLAGIVVQASYNLAAAMIAEKRRREG